MEKYIKENLILKYMKDNNLSKTSFCKNCKIACSTFDRILQGNKNIGLNMIGRIARTIGVELKDVFIDHN